MNSGCIPMTQPGMIKSEYWIKKSEDANKIIMDENEIEQYNKSVVDMNIGVTDIFSVEATIDREYIYEKIKSLKPQTTHLYDRNGKKVKKERISGVLYSRAMNNIEDQKHVSYGICTRNTDIRSLPSSMSGYSSANDIEFDVFQESGLQAFEVVIILHLNRNKNWMFVQTEYYSGWVKSSCIAEISKEEAKKWTESKEYIVVTGNYIRTRANSKHKRISNLLLSMGTRLVLDKDQCSNVDNQNTLGNYVVDIPIRDSDGKAMFVRALIGKNEDVYEGYLPFTQDNLLRQAFKLQGDRYGWGDSYGARDCSSTMMYIFRCFGIKLPRNTSSQERLQGKLYTFDENEGYEQRISAFRNFRPGTLVFMKGHVMMFIGMDNDVPYIIHNFSGYGKKTEDGYRFEPVNSMQVTSSLIMHRSGTEFLNRFTQLVQISL